MNEFINGECLEEMKKMPDESIDFIFTSPPYANQIKDYGATGIKINLINLIIGFYHVLKKCIEY